MAEEIDTKNIGKSHPELKRVEEFRAQVEEAVKHHPRMMVALVVMDPIGVDPVSVSAVLAPGYSLTESIEFGGWAAEQLSGSMVEMAKEVERKKSRIIQ